MRNLRTVRNRDLKPVLSLLIKTRTASLNRRLREPSLLRKRRLASNRKRKVQGLFLVIRLMKRARKFSSQEMIS